MIETLKPNSPETKPQVEVTKALKTATETLSNLEFESDFLAYLSDTNQTLDQEDPFSYWQVVANYTKTYLETHQDLEELERESFAVMANLPVAMVASYQLARYSEGLSRDRLKKCKETICSYNHLVKHFVTSFPQESETLHKEMGNAILLTAGNGSADFSDHASNAIGMMLKGLKHEIGFTRLLESAHIPYRESTTEEDLKGKDVIILFNGNEIGVDIKASLSEIEALRKDAEPKPYVIKPNGNVVMYSMMLESHFDGGFEPTSDRLKAVEETARGIIGMAVIEAIAKK